MAEIMRETGISYASIQTYVDKFEDLGLVKKEKVGPKLSKIKLTERGKSVADKLKEIEEIL